MIYHDFNAYCNALECFRGTPGKIINGQGFFEVDGNLIPDEIFFQHNSRPVFQYAPRQNSDKTNISSEIIIKKRK